MRKRYTTKNVNQMMIDMVDGPREMLKMRRLLAKPIKRCNRRLRKYL